MLTDIQNRTKNKKSCYKLKKLPLFFQPSIPYMDMNCITILVHQYSKRNWNTPRREWMVAIIGMGASHTRPSPPNFPSLLARLINCLRSFITAFNYLQLSFEYYIRWIHYEVIAYHLDKRLTFIMLMGCNNNILIKDPKLLFIYYGRI